MRNWRNRRSTEKSEQSTVFDNHGRPKKAENNDYHNSSFYSLPPSNLNDHNYQRAYSTNEQSFIDQCDYMMPLDPSIMLATFQNHWYQTCLIMTSKMVTSHGFNPQVPRSKLINSDDISSVVNNIEQMLALLRQEAKRFTNTSIRRNNNTSSSHPPSSPSPSYSLLEYFLEENILDKIFNWSCDIGEFTNTMKLEQLKIYELLFCHYVNCDLIFKTSVIQSLHELLSICSKACPLDVEKRLVALLNAICVRIGADKKLLKLFFTHEQVDLINQAKKTDNSQKRSKYIPGRKEIESRFLLFSSLISYVHREGIIGQQARDGLLLIMPISQTNEALSHYISNDSNLGPVMATILSGLYSSLPRILSTLGDHVQISEEDIGQIPELQIFLQSLDFCNSVVQVSHPLIKKQLIDLIYQGFLVPVIGPALHEEMNIPLDILENSSKHSGTIQQIVTTTAYIECCIRRVTEPDLLKIFLKFICIEKFDEQRILNTLIARIQATTKLSLITLILIRTIIDLDCEDVILELLLRYLIDCKNIFDVKHDNGSESDISIQFLNSVKKFLSLVPTFSQQRQQQSVRSSSNHDPLPPVSSSSPSTSTYLYEPSDYKVTPKFVSHAPNSANNFFESYFNYLDEAHTAILNCKSNTASWVNKYEPKITNDGQTISPPSDSGIFLTTSSSSNFNLDCQKLAGLAAELNYDTQSASSSSSTNDSGHISEAEMIGPFLSNLLSRLSQLPFNDYQVNLQLTGLIVRLSIFSEYHLKSLFLNCDLKLHKSVRSLFSIVVSLKRQLEDMSKKIDNFNELYNQEKINLLSLSGSNGKKMDLTVCEQSETSFTIKPNLDKKTVKKRRSLRSFLPWMSNNSKLEECPSLESLDNGYKFINKKCYNDEDEGIDGSSKSAENFRIIHAAIVYEEFIKKLAAISMEHYLLAEINSDQCDYQQLLPTDYYNILATSTTS